MSAVAVAMPLNGSSSSARGAELHEVDGWTALVAGTAGSRLTDSVLTGGTYATRFLLMASGGRPVGGRGTGEAHATAPVPQQ
jgi:hypothetical protein